MSTPAEALARLDGHAAELDDLSKRLAGVQRQLEDSDRTYQDFVDDYETGLYLKSKDPGVDDGPKLPSDAMRKLLARRAMDPELLGRRDGLIHKRDRLKQRIGDLKEVIQAERSVLSALKVEAELQR